MSKYKLTIAVLTMNRAEQMRHAVESCLDSALPVDTQFLIVDTASTDHTQRVVSELKDKSRYALLYNRLSENRGVGGGRNVCFDLAEGEYLYILDDDAEIPIECNQTFFIKALKYLDKNKDVMTLTTRIEDNVYGKRTPIEAKNLSKDGLPCVYSFQGGSTFLRKEYFQSPLFMNIMYGHEEVSVAMHVMDEGYYNVYMSEIYVNHLPKIDKWKINKNHINLGGISNLYAIKSMLYPAIFRLPLWIVFMLRLRRYRIKDKAMLAEKKEARIKFMMDNKLEKIRVLTVIKALKEFGITVF